MGIRVDDRLPVQAVSRMISDPILLLRPLHVSADNRQGGDARRRFDGAAVIVSHFSDFSDVTDPTKPAALIKAVMIVLNVAKRTSGKYCYLYIII